MGEALWADRSGWGRWDGGRLCEGYRWVIMESLHRPHRQGLPWAWLNDAVGVLFQTKLFWIGMCSGPITQVIGAREGIHVRESGWTKQAYDHSFLRHYADSHRLSLLKSNIILGILHRTIDELTT